MENTTNAPNEVRTVELGNPLQFKFTYPSERSYDSFFLFRPNESYIFKIDNNQTHSCLEYERNNVLQHLQQNISLSQTMYVMSFSNSNNFCYDNFAI